MELIFGENGKASYIITNKGRELKIEKLLSDGLNIGLGDRLADNVPDVPDYCREALLSFDFRDVRSLDSLIKALQSIRHNFNHDAFLMAC